MKKNRMLLRIIIIYIGLILLVPLALRIPTVNKLVRFYLMPLGNLRAEFIIFIGATLGVCIAIAGLAWIHERNTEHELEGEVKKSARIIYYDFLMALKDLLPFYRYVAQQEGKNINYSEEIKLLRKYCPSIHLENTGGIVEKLINSNEGALIEEIYALYGQLNNIRLVISGQITDYDAVFEIISACERCFDHKLTNTEWETKINKQSPLKQLREVAEINDYKVYPERNTKRWLVRVLKYDKVGY